MKNLPKTLRSLVGQSVAILGQVIRRELGEEKYRRIENLRQSMTEIRMASNAVAFQKLKTHFEELEALDSKQLYEIGHAFTLMLELMNVCENAYRSFRLAEHKPEAQAAHKRNAQSAIIYVMTAHPTEARSPQNIAAFHIIQSLLIRLLHANLKKEDLEISSQDEAELFHAIQIAWHASIVRSRKPSVKDEAEHIYSMLFREDILNALFGPGRLGTPLYIRSWVGGDKDGHPGVDEKAMLQSLSLSRHMLLSAFHQELLKIRNTLALFSNQELHQHLALWEKTFSGLRHLKSQDAKRVLLFRKRFVALKQIYLDRLGVLHPSLQKISHLLHAFPGLVIPLELRESSEVLMDKSTKPERLAIYRMLQTLEKLSKGSDPKWYARGFIISMAGSIEHLKAADRFQTAVFGSCKLPIIPLFEDAKALSLADQIVSEFVQNTKLKKAAVDHWKGMLEMMVGYSDSAKESGVLSSRLAISQALPKLEKVCEKAHLTPVFFHGSGGSVDRGGGSIEDQTAWWPASALRHYKVTVQGEMVERYLATPEISLRQIDKIQANAHKGLANLKQVEKNPNLEAFALSVSEFYRQQITDPEFLNMVETATPYSYLSYLKIGSRPSKRSTQLSVKGLRAIPWVLCWTQTRILFPTWWGVGSAWEAADASKRKALKEAFRKNPMFTSYIKALGFTLAKIELPVFRLYLEKSGLSLAKTNQLYQAFEAELKRTSQCHLEISVQKDKLWFRPWLGESIELRSAMIHPLNLLQILAQKRKDKQLLRLTVTGIASGMLTTG